MITCTNCGSQNDASARFCSQCGAAMAGDLDHTGALTSLAATGGTSGALQPVGQGTDRTVEPGGCVLIIQRGPGQGTEYPLAPTRDVVTIGRAPEADIFLDDVTVSRKHAEIRKGAEGWSVRDSGSLNGTYVNRVRVDDQHLRGGEEIQIGKFRFLFLVGPEPIA
jgi:hypothetical protein